MHLVATTDREPVWSVFESQDAVHFGVFLEKFVEADGVGFALGVEFNTLLADAFFLLSLLVELLDSLAFVENVLATFFLLLDLFLVLVLLLVLDFFDHLLDLWCYFLVLCDQWRYLVVKPALEVYSQVSVWLRTQITCFLQLWDHFVSESEQILFRCFPGYYFLTDLLLVLDEDLLLEDSSFAFFSFSFTFGFESLSDHELSISLLLVHFDFRLLFNLLLFFLKFVDSRHYRPSD